MNLQEKTKRLYGTWPPPHIFNWHKQGIDWETCK